MNRRIPVFTDDPGWHGKRLKEAFATRGYEAQFVSLKDCYIQLNDQAPTVIIPGFESSLPTHAFVRGVPGGTLQQVIARLNILHALQMLGVRVYNTGKAVEHTVDKSMTSFLLHLNGIATPRTWVCESRHHAQRIIDRELAQAEAIVIKPLFGSQGQGVRLLTAESPFPVPMEEHVDGLYYLQEYIDSGEGKWHDHRVFVIRGKAVGAMVRHGNSWINNVAQGGRCEPLSVDSEIADIAVKAAAAINIDYCGVDVIRDTTGKLYVLEVNSIPAWKGLQSVVSENVALMLVDDLLDSMPSQ